MATRGAEGAESYDSASQRHAARHESFLRYRGLFWAKLASVVALLAVVSYLLVDVEPRHNGGSWYGYALGTIGALLILWLTLLGVRKRAMTPGRWSLKAWTSAHVYLGISLIFIATLHTGFQLGWNVHTLAWALMLLVILSGLFGITVYGFLPRYLSDNRDETTEEQMLATVGELDRQLREAAQPLDTRHAAIVQRALDEEVAWASVRRRLFGTRFLGTSADSLAEIRRETLLLRAPDPHLDRVEALLARKVAALQRIRSHMRVRALLEAWLYVHVPMTFATIAALSAHIVSVFFYW
ncbi:MAG: hypothetical protein H7X93_10855 [Sphingomonadaceae bacterium]|nr:hypothetical protein [Sphingomonadaceae bacterium]